MERPAVSAAAGCLRLWIGARSRCHRQRRCCSSSPWLPSMLRGGRGRSSTPPHLRSPSASRRSRPATRAPVRPGARRHPAPAAPRAGSRGRALLQCNCYYATSDAGYGAHGIRFGYARRAGVHMCLPRPLCPRRAGQSAEQDASRGRALTRTCTCRPRSAPSTPWRPPSRQIPCRRPSPSSSSAPGTWARRSCGPS